MKNEVTTWLCAQAEESYDIRIQKPVPRLTNALTKVVIMLKNSLRYALNEFFHLILLIITFKNISLHWYLYFLDVLHMCAFVLYSD